MANNLMTIIKLGFIVTFLSVIIGGQVMTEATMTCNNVVSALGSCVSYLTGGGAPSISCCDGVKKLNAMAQTTTDRQAVCRCLKSVANGVKYDSRNIAYAAALPSKCGVKLPYDINPNVDCSTIKM